MSVVGELPLDIAGPPKFCSAQFDFDVRTCGHSRQPSHRRTASLIMMYFDESLADLQPELQRPGTPNAASAAYSPFADCLAKEEISWGKLEENLVQETVPLSQPRSSAGSSMRGLDRPDVEELFEKHWVGSACGSGSLGSSKSSQGTPKSARPGGSPVKRFFANIFKSRQQRERALTGFQEGSFSSSMDGADNLYCTAPLEHEESPIYQPEDDSESVDTVIEYDVESDDATSSQTEDANMRNDLYTEFDKTSTGDDTVTSDSIDEEEFPLSTIAESSQEVSKWQEYNAQESLDNSDSTILFNESLEISQTFVDTDSVSDGEHCASFSGSPKFSLEHTHTVSDLSQPESEMLLPEIVTGGILQSLHEEINRDLAENGPDDESMSSYKFYCEEYHQDKCSMDVANADDVSLMQTDALASESHNGAMYLGVRWVRLVPDKDIVVKIHTGIAKAAEVLATNWQWIPFVALPLLHLALSH